MELLPPYEPDPEEQKLLEHIRREHGYIRYLRDGIVWTGSWFPYPEWDRNDGLSYTPAAIHVREHIDPTFDPGHTHDDF